MIVMKFGGTSTAGKEAISRLVDIVRSRVEKKPVVVVSAMAGVTNALYAIAEAAEAKDAAKVHQMVESLRDEHIQVAEELLGEQAGLLLPATSKINEIIDELDEFAGAICAIGELSDRSKAMIVSRGELLSSTLVGYALDGGGIPTEWVDARQMIITSDEYLCGEPDMDAISEKTPGVIAKAFEGHSAVITQGFVSSTADGITTVLGRGGSDYSASLIGMAVDAETIEIWTDVDGVLTADPRMVPDAKRLDSLSFQEAAEMAHFGAKVLHPLTIEPAVKKNIPIYVLNSSNPTCPGTLILDNVKIESSVKSVSFKANILVVNIYSAKMINATGFLGKVFDVFSKYNVSVDLISTSEASISVTVDASVKNLDKVVAELSQYASVDVDKDKSQVSVIGKNLVSIPGVMNKVFHSIENIPVYMISQGTSYINMSIVIDKSDLQDCVRNIHNSLFA